MEGKKINRRSPKLASVLTRVLSVFFQQEMELTALVSVSHIDVAPNMQTAVVWLSIYGRKAESTLKLIEGNSRNIRNYLKENVVARYIPSLYFKIDPSEQYADDLGKVFKRVEEEK